MRWRRIKFFIGRTRRLDIGGFMIIRSLRKVYLRGRLALASIRLMVPAFEFLLCYLVTFYVINHTFMLFNHTFYVINHTFYCQNSILLNNIISLYLLHKYVQKRRFITHFARFRSMLFDCFYS